MVDTEMTATPTQQPEALRLADVLEKMPGYDWNKTYCEAAFQLRHIQHQNECLTAEIEKQRTARIEAQTENEELKAAVSDAVAAEREACAVVCDSWTTAMTDSLAEEIRARGTP